MTQFNTPVFVDSGLDGYDYMQYKLCIGVDVGTDGLGIAYAIAGKVYVHSKWSSEKYRDAIKQKTIILLDKDGNKDAFGLDAKEVYMKLQSKKDHMLFERFKMSLYDNEINSIENNVWNDDEKKSDHIKIDIKRELRADNGRKYPSELVFIEAFKYIQKESKTFLRKKKIKAKKNEIQWIITVPAIWSDKAKYKMKQWIIKAGLVDGNDKNQCKIVYEPDCASLAIQYGIRNAKQNDDYKNDNYNTAAFRKGEKYVLVDAGGGTVDIACHEIMGEFSVKEVLPPSGGPWGSCYIDDQYKKTLNQIFGDDLMNEFKTKHPNVYMQVIDHFQSAKATFDGNRKHHNCRLATDFVAWLEDKFEDDDNIEDAEDFVAKSIMGKSHLVKLIMDEILSFSNMVWISMFDKIINPIQQHIEKLLNDAAMMRNCRYLCLVGGLSCSPYFQNRMKNMFGEQSKFQTQIIIPQRPILSVVQGAAYLGITKNYIKARRMAKTYGIAVDYTIKQALENGLSESYIDKKKYWQPNTQEYFVRVFFPIINKGTEVWMHQVIEDRKLRHGTLSECLIEILSSTKSDPKWKYSPQDTVAQSKIVFKPSDPPNAYLTIQWHFYDTTIKIIYYVTKRPEDKRELEIEYDFTDSI